MPNLFVYLIMPAYDSNYHYRTCNHPDIDDNFYTD
jgi:hypothetical protein